ncbi:MAG: prepilin-type N-terminal cleavage/methylation domain-containing protein [Ruminococcus sp.]|nr:prepilin-type N-terminal cleavage/methylation domain-containing protein [Ruminococcus sp.]
MKKTNKKLKGMTLIEMIISLAIFAVMSLVLLVIGQVVDKQMRATTNLKEKVVQQSPLAANRITKCDQIQLDANGQPVTDASGLPIVLPTSELPTTPIVITIKVDGNGQYYLRQDPNDPNSPIDPNAHTFNDPSISINCKKYDTKQAVRDLDVSNGKPNDGLSLEFVEIEPTTAATT